MVKRKISDYYAQRKRRASQRVRRSTKAARTRTNRRRYKSRSSTRRVGRGSRRIRRKKNSNIKTTTGNLRTTVQDIIDSVVVSQSTGTAGAADIAGKRCVYYYVGVNQGQSLALGSLPHLLQMASVIETDEVSIANQSNILSETKFMVKDSFQEYDIVNTSNGAGRLRIYYCTFKRDVLNGESQADIRAILGDGFYQRGLTANRASGNTGLFDPALTPFQSHKFCSYITINKVETCIMDPGQMITRKITTGSYMFTASHYTTQTAVNQTSAQSTADYSHRRGEKFILIQLEGQPANDSGGNLTYTSPKIDVNAKTSYTYQSINRQAPLLQILTAQGFKVPASGGVQLMEDETGAVVNQVNA